MDLTNFYSLLPKDKEKHPKGYKKHLIDKNSRVLMIGASGSGKTNALINYIEMSSGEYTQIIICSFSTTDEPLYQYLKDRMPEVELINDIEEVPEIQSFDDEEKNKSKLIVFDDFICLNKKQMKILEDYAISSRKFGFTCIYMCQEYTQVPKVISRNCNYILCFKINDKISIKRIIYNHGLSSLYKPEEIEHKYYYCLNKPLSFLLIDLKTNDDSRRLRCGFNEFI